MKIKIAVLISILTFFVVSTASLASFLVVRERNRQIPKAEIKDVPEAKTEAQATPDSNSITIAKVAEHSTPSDCWIIVNSKAYDVTKFLNEHPGGSITITPYCGKDATNAFNTKDKSPSQKHTSFANDLLSKYLVGSIGEVVEVKSKLSNQITKTLPPVAVATPAPKPQNITTTLSSAEVATHSTSSNCWIIISNNVYNVTNYLVGHPGGVSVITKYCGQDSTGAFTTKDGRGKNHSTSAYSQLNSYLVGSIGSTISTTNNSSTAINATNNPSQTQINNSNTILPTSVTTKYPGASLKKAEDDGEEIEIITSSGACRHIKLNSSGAITSDQSC